MTGARLHGFYLLLLGGLAFVLIGLLLESSSRAPMLDFAVVYNPSRCLLQHHDPYNEDEVLGVYQAGKTNGPSIDPVEHPVTRRLLYLPSAFCFTRPFALLAWGTAHIVWMTLTLCGFLFAAYLIWRSGAESAPVLSGVLLAFLLANSEMLVVLANAAGISIALCIVSVYCFLRRRCVAAGILCMALSLALKPHDAGLVWLYFLLAGGVYRKRALQTLLAAALISLPFVLWVTHIAPNWIEEWHANMSSFSDPGGINDPGLAALRTYGHASVINLQALISIFRDNPRFYDPAAWLFCGALLLFWSWLTLRARISPLTAWLALASIAPLTLLITGHHLYDTKLLLLTIPACALLWAEGGAVRWMAALVTAAGLVFTGDIPLAVLSALANRWQIAPVGLTGKLLFIALLQPVPLVLLGVAIFYLWIYARRVCEDKAVPPHDGALAGLQ
jgi:hypothetical protein